MTLGVDVSHYQPPTLPWDAWRSQVEIVVIQTYHGDHAEPLSDIHLANALMAGYQHIGAYAFLYAGRGAEQCAAFLAALNPAYSFCALDIEQAGVSAADVLAWCNWYDAHCHLPLVLYGNNALSAIMAQYPQLDRYGVWWANYPLGTANVSAPPAGWHPSAPDTLNVVAWQFTGTGRLPPYSGDIDLSIWYSTPGVSMTPVVSHGSKLGIHSITNHALLPLVRKAVSLGLTWPVVKCVNDGSSFPAIKAISPATLCILRLMPTNKDDEGLQNCDQWNDAQRQAWAKRLLDLYYANGHAGADYYDPINEPGAHGVSIYTGYGLALLELVWQANAAGIKLSVPALPQGTPEYAEMLALKATGIFKALKAGGHLWDCHEGVMAHQPIDYGYGDLIPGAPSVPLGAGSTNFRHRYLYSLLAADERPPLVISEWYGGKLGLEQIKWYDARLRETPYALAFLPYTIDPTPDWANEDYTPTYNADLFAYLVAEKDNPNGVTTMPYYTDAQVAQIKSILDNPSAAPHVWRAGDVALAVANPLTTYAAPGGAVHDTRVGVTYDLDVGAVSTDGLWLQVASLPLWVRAADVKLKGS